MEQRTRIQEIIDDIRMTTTTRSPVKAKSLTLLELCQTINDLRHPNSRNTAQILTRRLYLHPLTINAYAKHHSSKLPANHLLEPEPPPPPPSRKHHKSYRGLAVLSSSVPLTTRSNNHTNTKFISSSTTTEHEDSSVLETSTVTTLPPINRGLSSSSSSRRIKKARTSYIPHQQKPNVNPPHRWEKLDVWHHLARTLQRPTPKDPPTTPLDFHIHRIQESAEDRRSSICNSIIHEND